MSENLNKNDSLSHSMLFCSAYVKLAQALNEMKIETDQSVEDAIFSFSNRKSKSSFDFELDKLRINYAFAKYDDERAYSLILERLPTNRIIHPVIYSLILSKISDSSELTKRFDEYNPNESISLDSVPCFSISFNFDAISVKYGIKSKSASTVAKKLSRNH